MSKTSWNYRPTNSARYPGVGRSDAFITQPRARALGTPRDSAASRRLRTPCKDAEIELVTRLARPTISSRIRFDTPALSSSFVNRPETWDHHYQWHKMDYLRDSYKCIWSRHGAVKHTFQL